MSENARNLPILIAICALLLIPAAACHQLGGIEFRTALFVGEILGNGPSFIPRLYGFPYYDYPPLYFLIAAALAKVAGGISPFVLSLPSLLAAIGTVAVTFIFGKRVSRSLGWMAGIALLVTPLFCFLAHQAIVDILLTFFTTSAIVCFYLGVRPGKACLLLLACLGMAGAALTKGPIGAALPLTVIIVYLLILRRLRLLIVTIFKVSILLILIVAVCSIILVMTEGTAAFKELVDAQLLDRLKDPPNKPYAYYLGVFFGGFAPWSLFAFLCLFLGREREETERQRIRLFSIVWLITTLFIFTLASVKHTRYLLPAAPPTAILCALFWDWYICRRISPYIKLLLQLLRILCIVTLAVGTAITLIAPIWFPFSSTLLLYVLPLFLFSTLLISLKTPATKPKHIFFTLSAVLGLGFLLFCQFGLPSAHAKNDMRPFVDAVEEASQGCPVILFDIGLDQDGLKYAYWKREGTTLLSADTVEDLELLLLSESPAMVLAPREWKEILLGTLGDRLSFASDGKLGKTRCTVFYAKSGFPTQRQPG